MSNIVRIIYKVEKEALLDFEVVLSQTDNQKIIIEKFNHSKGILNDDTSMISHFINMCTGKLDLSIIDKKFRKLARVDHLMEIPTEWQININLHNMSLIDSIKANIYYNSIHTTDEFYIDGVRVEEIISKEDIPEYLSKYKIDKCNSNREIHINNDIYVDILNQVKDQL